MQLPVVFHALHFDADANQFYYDGTEIQHYDTRPDEQLHLRKAQMCIEDWIRMLEHEQLIRGQPLRDLLHDQHPFMAVTGEEATWKLGGGSVIS